MMCVGAVVFNAIVLLRAVLTARPLTYLWALASSETSLALLYLATLSSVGAFFLLNYALSRLSPSRVAVFVNLTPVISILAGVLFRGKGCCRCSSRAPWSSCAECGEWGGEKPTRVLKKPKPVR